MSLIVDKVNQLLKENVTVKIVTTERPIPCIIATAWLNSDFHLATEISKADITTGNFDRDQGIAIAESKALNTAKNKLFELEAYHAYQLSKSAKGDFKDRLYSEYNDLSSKIGKLEEFIDSGKIESMTEEHFLMLKEQLQHMKNYFSILSKRIDLVQSI